MSVTCSVRWQQQGLSYGLGTVYTTLVCRAGTFITVNAHLVLLFSRAGLTLGIGQKNTEIQLW